MYHKTNSKNNKDKKAMSEVVSYVLMIVIALALAMMVFVWLKLQTPAEILKCPDETTLLIQGYSCASGQISISFKNQGLFNISGFLIKAAASQEAEPSIPLSNQDSLQNGRYDFMPELAPSATKESISFDYANTIVKIQIQPFRIQQDARGKATVVLCGSIVNQKVEGC